MTIQNVINKLNSRLMVKRLKRKHSQARVLTNNRLREATIDLEEYEL